MYNCVTHVIFDMDGLLIDTESLYTVATQRVLEPHAKTFTYNIKMAMMGKPYQEANQILIDALDLPMTVEELQTSLNEQYNKLFPECKLMPGVHRLVHHLHSHHIPMAIASGSDRKGFTLKTQNHQDIFSLFHHIVLCGDDPEVLHSKPAPDPFLVAARRFGDSPDPSKVLVFEDAVNGVLSAHAAGMQCVWVPDPETDTTAMGDKATLVLNSVEEFRPEDFGLPPINS